MNRNMFRGVTAVVMAGALAGGGTVVGTAMASPSTPDAGGAGALPAPAKAVTVDTLDARRLAAKRSPARMVRRPASRTHLRRSLTGSPRTIARALLLRRGWSERQWGCLEALWDRESHWNTYAHNSSGAYGIPQSLPATKMSMMGSDWRTNPITQIRWGLYYIGATYGSPCNALAHSNSYGYY